MFELIIFIYLLCVISLLIKNKRRDFLMAILSIVVLIITIYISFFTNDFLHEYNYFLVGLSFQLNDYNALIAVIISFVFCISLSYSIAYKKANSHLKRYTVAMLFTQASSLAIVYSADLFTLYLFFELMSLSSAVLVINNEKPAAFKAGKIYLAYGIITGIVTLLGLFLLNSQVKSLNINYLISYFNSIDNNSFFVIMLLIIVAFIAKAGIFPFHQYIATSHAVTATPSSVILSSVLLKLGLYSASLVIIKFMYQNPRFITVMIILAMFTMFLAGLYALFSNNLKKILGYSSVSQIGFIFTGITMAAVTSNAYATSGFMLYIINHAILKTSLFMISGLVILNMHTLDLTKLKGFGRDKPFLKVFFIVIALSFTAVPGFSTYLAKTLIHESIIHNMQASIINLNLLKTLETVFLISGGFTVAYILKIAKVFFFDEKSSGVKKHNEHRYLDNISKFIFSVLLVITILLAIPNVALGIVNKANTYFNNSLSSFNFYNGESILSSLKSITLGIVFFLIMLKTSYKDKKYLLKLSNFNIEKKVYIPVLLSGLPMLLGLVFRLLSEITDTFILILNKLIFNQKNQKIIDKEDDYFTIYDFKFIEQIEKRDDLSISLVLISLGIIITLLVMFI